ncbi:MAG: glyoxalase [Candidatus Eremiobacteraeota bacterium]|nr:glyoxalase [Candidatus Eremiobacteraeota bacterium]
MPRGREEEARKFYCAILGMTELPKPAELAKRGGCWFASGGVQLHLGVEDDFRASQKAHPGLQCTDFDGLLSALRNAGADVKEDDATGQRRAFVHDPFGNRIELISSG